MVQVDFSEGRGIFAKIAESIRGKEIGMLGNFISFRISFLTILSATDSLL